MSTLHDRIRAATARTWNDIWGGIRTVADENPWLFAAVVLLVVVLL